MMVFEVAGMSSRMPSRVRRIPGIEARAAVLGLSLWQWGPMVMVMANRSQTRSRMSSLLLLMAVIAARVSPLQKRIFCRDVVGDAMGSTSSPSSVCGLCVSEGIAHFYHLGVVLAWEVGVVAFWVVCRGGRMGA